MVERVMRSGVSGRPGMTDFVVMKKDGIDGTSRVHPRAFRKVWEPKGWKRVEPETTAGEDSESDALAETVGDSPQDAPPVTADTQDPPAETAPARKTKTTAKTDAATSEES